MPSATPPPKKPAPLRRRPRRLRRWLAIVVGIPLVVVLAVTGYYYITFARMIDERLRGERVRTIPKVFARPFEIRRGQWLSAQQVVDRLNDLGYAERAKAEKPGEFGRIDNLLTLLPRGGDQSGRTIRATFRPLNSREAGPVGPDGKMVPTTVIDKIEIVGGRPVEAVRLEQPLMTALVTANREKRRSVSLSLLPKVMVHAVLAIEDRRFYEHPGIDPIRIIGAIITNLRGNKPYLVGGSTLTQQLVKNFFLTPEKSMRRKVQEQFLAMVLETRASKDAILELYLNDVYLGQRGSFAIHGVPEAARLFFGKDVTNLTLAEAATIAGVIQAPFTHSPFSSTARARDRRNVVLQAMADAGYVATAAAERAGREPVQVVAHALDTEAPYFIDLLGQELAEQYPGLLASTQPVEIYTTLDINQQRIAQDAVHAGLVQIDDLLSRRKNKTRAQVALIAIDPRSGDILAMVGGRSYNQSQFNRALAAKRQPGSVFKPFVYLAAFESAAADGRTDMTPATVVDDEKTTFTFEDKEWTPGNYEDEYDGSITLRRALAHSRNVATVKVAQMTGYDKIANLWKALGATTVPKPYPSIALGVFEATPFEVASAYTVFPNYGELRPLRPISRIVNGGTDLAIVTPPAKRVTRRDTTYLVTNMMRSVLNEGTGATSRNYGFALDAAGKTGTTNDLRDAWFVGFTPELLTAVWVGFDDNQPLGLSGAIAALPIWTRFMMGALAGRPSLSFAVPDGITMREIDRDTGRLAQPACPRLFNEAFLIGAEPIDVCGLHKF
ncbi:MAG: PBP1A family penicillin-binding protein [Acidobacteriota bacterium]